MYIYMDVYALVSLHTGDVMFSTDDMFEPFEEEELMTKYFLNGNKLKVEQGN